MMQKRITPLNIAVTVFICAVFCWLEVADYAFFDSAPLIYLLVEIMLFVPAVFFGNVALRRDFFAVVSVSIAVIYSIIDRLHVFITAEDDRAKSLFALAAAVISVSTVSAYLRIKSAPARSEAGELLATLLPETANVLRDGKETVIPSSEITDGDIVAVKPGEVLPCSGKIVAGRSELDERVLRGELTPKFCSEGDAVRAGCLNLSGFLTVRASAGKGELDGLLESYSKAAYPAKRGYAEQFKRLYTVAAIAAVAVFSLIALTRGFYESIFALAVLLGLFCPCGLDAVSSFCRLAAAKRAQSEGQKLSDLSVLSRLCKVTVAVIDRTGTATVGKLAVTDVIPTGDTSDRGMIRLAAALCAGVQGSDFAAITEHCRHLDIAVPPCIAPERFTGGIRGTVDGQRVLLSSLKEDAESFYDRPELEGKVLRTLFLDSELIGAIALSDSIKPNAIAAVKQFRERGVRSVLISGGSENVEQDAAALGIEIYCADMSAEDKYDYVRSLQSGGDVVAVIAEGISDAAALKVADCGFALVSGDEIAKEAASVTLLRNDLRDAVSAVELASYAVKAEKLGLAVLSSVRVASMLAAATSYTLGSAGLGVLICTAGLIVSEAVPAVLANVTVRFRKEG